MKNKHRFKSVDSAVRRIRQLERVIDQWSRLVEYYSKDRLLMARLAADSPQFSNPLEVWDAKKLRDDILKSHEFNHRDAKVKAEKDKEEF